MAQQAQLQARLGISGTLEYRDKDGAILKTVQISGGIPLESLGLTVEDAQQLMEQANGPDHRQ